MTELRLYILLLIIDWAKQVDKTIIPDQFNMENIPVIFFKMSLQALCIMTGVDLFEIQSRKFLPPLISNSLNDLKF